MLLINNSILNGLTQVICGTTNQFITYDVHNPRHYHSNYLWSNGHIYNSPFNSNQQQIITMNQLYQDIYQRNYIINKLDQSIRQLQHIEQFIHESKKIFFFKKQQKEKNLKINDNFQLFTNEINKINTIIDQIYDIFHTQLLHPNTPHGKSAITTPHGKSTPPPRNNKVYSIH